MKKAWKNLPCWRCGIIGAVLMLGLWAPQALAVPELSLPDSAQMTATYNGVDGLWNLNLYNFTGIGPYDISEGVYAGWCVDKHTNLEYNHGTVYDVDLYSTYGDIPDDLEPWHPDRGGSWNKINYLINQDTYTVPGDIQWAIWWYIDGIEASDIPDPLKLDVLALVALADDYENTWGPFVPGSGDVVAVLLDPSYYDEQTFKDVQGQRVIIEAPAPIPEGSTLILFGSGLSGLLFFARKKGLLKF